MSLGFGAPRDQRQEIIARHASGQARCQNNWDLRVLHTQKTTLHKSKRFCKPVLSTYYTWQLICHYVLGELRRTISY